MSLRKSIRHTFSLYFGKLGGVAATLIFIPLFRKIFSETDFGWISIVLSLQTIIYVLDFGLATHLSRRASRLAEQLDAKKRFGKILGLAQLSIRLMYLVISLIFISTYFLFSCNWSVLFSGLVILLLGFQTEMNLWSQLLLSLKKYEWSSYLQLFATLSRASLSFILVKIFSANVIYFLLGQIVAAYIFQVIAKNVLGQNSIQVEFWWAFKNFCLNLNKKKLRYWYALLAKSWPLFLAMAVGALTTQADRLMIATFISPAQAGDYFVALTFAMTPVLIVAQPIFQFFQPYILSTINTNHFDKWFARYCIVLHLVVFATSLFLYIMMNELFRFWLHVQDVEKLVVLAQLLMAGACAAAYSFLTYTLLLSHGLYKKIKLISIMTSSVYLILLYWACMQGSLVYVAVSFIVFNVLTYFLQLYLSRSLWVKSNQSIVFKFLIGAFVFNTSICFVPHQFYQSSIIYRLTLLSIVELIIILIAGLYLKSFLGKKNG